MPGNVAISADKITKPYGFIVFAPAQASTATGELSKAQAASAAPGVTVLAAIEHAAWRNATGGTHNNRSKNQRDVRGLAR